MADRNQYEIPELAHEEVGPIRISEINLCGYSFKLAYPEFPDQLLDCGKVRTAFAADEYMPYWATLWPVASFLSEIILLRSWTPGQRTLELGCGLGLPGLAAMAKGLSVVFSDYDATALKFVETNCRLNNFVDFQTLKLDLRSPPDGTFDIILASDLIYERRHVAPLVALIKKNLAPDGFALVADQNRPYQENFLACLAAQGFTWIVETRDMQNQEKQWTKGSVFTISRL